MYKNKLLKMKIPNLKYLIVNSDMQLLKTGFYFFMPMVNILIFLDSILYRIYDKTQFLCSSSLHKQSYIFKKI